MTGAVVPYGLEVAPWGAGQSRLRCPICTWGITVTDHGDTLELDTTEGRIRAHLNSHGLTEWLAAVASLRQVQHLHEQWMIAADLCPQCGGDGEACRVLVTLQRKCCPDCQHRVTPPDRG